MDRLHIYNTRTLVAVEFASTPSSLAGIGGRAHVFRRLDLGETTALHGNAMRATADPAVIQQLKHLMEVVGGRVAYWENLVPPGLKDFVHHVRFDDEARGADRTCASRSQTADLALPQARPDPCSGSSRA